MTLDRELTVAFSALCGLLIGSFLNVCIYRLPRDLSIVRPRSHCPGCGKMVRAYDNIPLLSFLVLRGKCRDCGEPISWRYPAVELLTAALFAWFAATEASPIVAGRNCVLCALLLALIFTDLETRLLPEQLTIGGIVAGLLFAAWTPIGDGFGQLLGFGGRPASVVDSLIGVLIPALPLWLMGWVFKKVRHKQGLGFGDVVLIAEVGAFLGARAAFVTLLAASIAGSVVGTIYILWKREDAGTYQLPLGSFLAGAGIFAAIAGHRF